jgi:S1-C subfamily serine protease
MILIVLGAGCGSIQLASTRASLAPPLDPVHRTVRIETAGCGLAPDRVGSGVAIGDGLVLTVAHLVARADNLTASVGSSDSVNAVVTAVDLNLDLALLRIPPDEMPAIQMASASEGTGGRIVGGAASGTVPFVVKEVVRLSIEEILGTERHSRLGYELEAATTTGDSGAGAYDGEDRLIGIVFATGQEGGSSWITASAEIEDFLAAHDSDDTSVVCDPEISRIVVP